MNTISSALGSLKRFGFGDIQDYAIKNNLSYLDASKLLRQQQMDAVQNEQEVQREVSPEQAKINQIDEENRSIFGDNWRELLNTDSDIIDFNMYE